MARIPKTRRICHIPETLEFRPVPDDRKSPPVVLTVDEYETIRLIDHLGLSQEQCSHRMAIARTTAQKIYDSARKKLAAALVDGRPLEISGGAFQLCNGQDQPCGNGQCYKQALSQFYESKGEHTMRIAVTYENGQIFQHFGHTQEFKVYEVEDGKILSAKVVGTNGQGHGALAQVLYGLQADVLICGGIGGGAQMALANVGIKLYGGVTGDPDAAVAAFLAGTLDYNPDVRCNHHDHEEGHACGNHGCGSHSCH